MNTLMNTSQFSDTPSAFTAQSIKTHTKSAFTPIIQKPVPQRQSPQMNLFEPSPIQKILFMTAAALAQQ